MVRYWMPTFSLLGSSTTTSTAISWEDEDVEDGQPKVHRFVHRVVDIVREDRN